MDVAFNLMFHIKEGHKPNMGLWYTCSVNLMRENNYGTNNESMKDGECINLTNNSLACRMQTEEANN